MSTNEEPVTVIARHSVLAGKEAEFETWITGISDACSAFTGYLGTEVIRPVDPKDSQYVCIFRFNDFKNLDMWMDSAERAKWLETVKPLSSAETRLKRYQSLDFWFASQKHKDHTPSNHKMAAVTFIAIWPLVHFIPPALMPVFPGPLWLSEGIVVLLIVLLMTYLVMPQMTRLFSAWLFKD